MCFDTFSVDGTHNELLAAVVAVVCLDDARDGLREGVLEDHLAREDMTCVHLYKGRTRFRRYITRRF